MKEGAHLIRPQPAASEPTTPADQENRRRSKPDAEINTVIMGMLHVVRPYFSDARDLLRGLFPLATSDAPEGCDYAASLEDRYNRPRRCC